MVIIRKAETSDIKHIANHMRKCDQKEIWLAEHKTPRQALEESLDKSSYAFTALLNNIPVVMFGLAPQSLLSDEGMVWALATEDIEHMQKTFMVRSKDFITVCLTMYPSVMNYVHVENKKSLAWLHWLGATIYPAAPYGPENAMFRYFTIERRD